MNKEKALGSDVFIVGFLQKNEEVVRKDVNLTIKDFSKKGKIIKQWNIIFLALAPKILYLNDCKSFIPINLCIEVYI